MLRNLQELKQRLLLVLLFFSFSFSDLTFHFFSTGVVYCQSDILLSYLFQMQKSTSFLLVKECALRTI